jgi:hypothetical protein
MQAFLTLNPVYQARPLLTRDAAAYIRSKAFTDHVDKLQADPLALARLTCDLLGHFALDPANGSEARHFVTHSGTQDRPELLTRKSTTVLFSLPLYGVRNFIGAFSLPVGCPEARALVQAIRANLMGPRFKAAQMHARLAPRAAGRHRRFDKAATCARVKVLANARRSGDYTEDHTYAEDYAADPRRLREEFYVAANSAYDAVFEPLQRRSTRRSQAVRNAAFGADFRSSYPEVLTAFAVQYLIPPFLNERMPFA